MLCQQQHPLLEEHLYLVHQLLVVGSNSSLVCQLGYYWTKPQLISYYLESVNRSERSEYNAQQFKRKRQARQANVSIAEGFIHVSTGKRYYIHGVGQKRGGDVWKETDETAREGKKRQGRG